MPKILKFLNPGFHDKSGTQAFFRTNSELCARRAYLDIKVV